MASTNPLSFQSRMDVVNRQAQRLDTPSQTELYNSVVDTTLQRDDFREQAPADVKEFASMARSVAGNIKSPDLEKAVLSKALAFAVAGAVPGTPGVVLAQITAEAIQNVEAPDADKEAMVRNSLDQIATKSSDPEAKYQAEFASNAGTRASHGSFADGNAIYLNGLQSIAEIEQPKS